MLFLDYTLNRIIKRFEDQFPETRIAPRRTLPAAQETDSPSSEDLNSEPVIGTSLTNETGVGTETAADDEDVDHYDISLSRSSSMTSLHARAMTSEEGQVHRLSQNLRRDFLSPSMAPPSNHLSSSSPADDSHILSLREKLEQLQLEQMVSGGSFETVDGSKAIEGLGGTVDDLLDTQKWDAEAFARFKESQIAAQINSGVRKSFSHSPDDKPRDDHH